LSKDHKRNRCLKSHDAIAPGSKAIRASVQPGGHPISQSTNQGFSFFLADGWREPWEAGEDVSPGDCVGRSWREERYTATSFSGRALLSIVFLLARPSFQSRAVGVDQSGAIQNRVC
jgi:hypothetical protein